MIRGLLSVPELELYEGMVDEWRTLAKQDDSDTLTIDIYCTWLLDHNHEEIAQFTPIMISNIRWKTYMVFFLLNLAFRVVVWMFFLQTSGRNLDKVVDSLWPRSGSWEADDNGSDPKMPAHGEIVEHPSRLKRNATQNNETCRKKTLR
ncbi:hypothetical protein QBC33DRAFT_620844 [Phialemonium atrogriseum]|uniref:Uncharacterized protein n=1 Tax=Phialemonium atrogriseum TaxID=1093897 RepID=A0AAJ0BX69_9PEZI|nr:uncharacterized protein QBC33DRAFT_620844 [Phialemonium atrogriseum]KAK1765931.1 hypothetical protein QBC33DRAFT_620844 [Phialemonium atrogriseum]